MVNTADQAPTPPAPEPWPAGEAPAEAPAPRPERSRRTTALVGAALVAIGLVAGAGVSLALTGPHDRAQVFRPAGDQARLGQVPDGTGGPPYGMGQAPYGRGQRDGEQHLQGTLPGRGPGVLGGFGAPGGRA